MYGVECGESGYGMLREELRRAVEDNGGIDLERISVFARAAAGRPTESWVYEREASGNGLLHAAFGNEMHGIYRRALSEAGYKAARFLHLLHEHGGLQTARILIHAATVSEGYTAQWERGLDLIVEALIHDNPQWHPLFTPDELDHLHAKADGIPISEVILTASHTFIVRGVLAQPTRSAVYGPVCTVAGFGGRPPPLCRSLAVNARVKYRGLVRRAWTTRVR